MTSIEEIRVERANGVGLIELNRPKAMNALNLPMLHAIEQALDAWRDDPQIHAVVIYSLNARAFCAGGDIRFLYESAKAGENEKIETFFIDEYRLNHKIFTYPKPYIAFMNGVVMGGGMGISQGAQHTGGLRIVTGSTKMAMPETRIGLFPDVGATWFLARTPGAIGRYLSATGATIGPADALYAALADTHLPDAALPGLIDALKEQHFGSGGEVVGYIDGRTRRGASADDAGTLAQHRALIDAHFAHGNGAACLASLDNAPSATAQWAAHTAAELRERSPLSIDVSLEAVDRAKSMTMADTLRQDLVLTYSTFDRGDIVEGIRARIVDKDNQPAWKVKRSEDVARDDVVQMFGSPWREGDHPLAGLAD